MSLGFLRNWENNLSLSIFMKIKSNHIWKWTLQTVKYSENISFHNHYGYDNVKIGD